MQMIGEDVNPKQKKNKGQGLLLALIILLIIICITIYIYIQYLDSTIVKFYKDGQMKKIADTLLIEDNGTVYVSINGISSMLDYEFKQGIYNTDNQDPNKCYVKPIQNKEKDKNFEAENMVIAFSLDSGEILKTPITTQDGTQIDYDVYTISKPIKKINGEFYISIEGLQIAYHVKLTINANQVKLSTLPYLVQYYTQRIANYNGLAALSTDYSNQVALVYGFIIGSNANGEVGCVYTNGESTKSILDTRFQAITFNENRGELIAKIGGKYGIYELDGTRRIEPQYDRIELLDKNLNYYIVENGSKKGLIDQNGKIILHTDYTSIGIDISAFKTQNIKNSRLLFENCIPLVKDGKFGIVDLTGKTLMPFEIDAFGSKASSVDGKTVNPILIIPEYEAIIYMKNNKYGAIDKTGKSIIPAVLDNVYSITENNVTQYFMKYTTNGIIQTVNVIDYLKQQGIVEVKKEVKDTPVEEDITIEEDTNNTINNINIE